jgi:hypothetical protein
VINLVHSLSSEEVHTAFLVVGLLLLVVINIIFLVDIELTLSRNKHLQSSEDDQWGFGQVLALLLLVIPLRDAWNALRDIRTAARGVQKRFLQALQEEVEATPFVERLRDLINEGADSKEWIKDTEFGNSLQLAAYHGRTDIVKFLLSEDIPANKRVIDTKLSKIVKFYHIYHATHLCSGGTYGTALQAASASGHVEVVRLLLNKSTDTGYLDIEGEYFNVNGLGSNTDVSGRRVLWDSTSRCLREQQGRRGQAVGHSRR